MVQLGLGNWLCLTFMFRYAWYEVVLVTLQCFVRVQCCKHSCSITDLRAYNERQDTAQKLRDRIAEIQEDLLKRRDQMRGEQTVIGVVSVTGAISSVSHKLRFWQHPIPC